MKKTIVAILVMMVILAVSPAPVANAGIFEVESIFNIIGVISEVTKGEKVEINPPKIFFGGQFKAQVEQPKVESPDAQGWRKVIFPYDLVFQIQIGYIAKFDNDKHTVHLGHNGDIVKLKKGEPIWVKQTSQIQEFLEQAGTSLTLTVVSKEDLKKKEVIVSIPNDVVDIENIPTVYDFQKNGFAYKGKLINLYISKGEVEWWDQDKQKFKKALKGQTVQTSEFTWKK